MHSSSSLGSLILYSQGISHVNEIGECELESTGDVNSEGDTVILHKVAGICDITFQSDRYDSNRNMETKSAMTLFRIVCMISLHGVLQRKTLTSVTDMGDIEMRVVAICHNMISLVCKIHTPITFGLGVKLHHDHGSRELIDDVSSLEHSIPYDKVRRFLAAIALDQLSTKSDIHIPCDISVYYPENVRTTVMPQ